MQIGIDASRAFKSPRTGTERYAWEILRHLLAHPRAAQDTWHLYVDRALAPGEIAELLAGASVADGVADGAAHAAGHVIWHVLPWRRMWTHRVLGPAIRRAGLDVCFVPSHVVPFVWPARRNPPSVVTVHDLGYRVWPQTHPWRQRLYLELSTRWNLRAATQVITISQATARDIATTYAPPARVTVIHEAAARLPQLDAAAFATAIATVRAEFGLPPTYAIFTGTLHPRKNVERLLRAYARLLHSGQATWPLVLAGADGWQGKDFRALAERLDVAEHVRFLGYVPDVSLPALVAGARFFAFPSLFEGFGLPVLEAQELGVPVMTSNYSSLPEIAGDAALYVDPTDIDALADAMLRLSQDESLRQRLIAAGYANVQRFSWEKAADETYAVLRAAAINSDPEATATEDSTAG
ncbi:MAG: glycosyltransferase family 1 protein [Litorilinea sp.]